MSVPYEKLNLHIDMDYIFRRTERNLRHGVPKGQILEWVRNAVAEEIPPRTRWTHPAGGTFTGAQFHAAVLEHCTRWLVYLERYPPAPEPGEDIIRNAALEQLRLKL